MAITREQVADLQPGDVVRLICDAWPAGAALEGAVSLNKSDVLIVRLPDRDGQYWLRQSDGSVFDGKNRTLTVISRAPRTLYINHPRTEPRAGDVAKDATGTEPSGHTWHYLGDEEDGYYWWRFDDRMRNGQPKVMRLLIDGEIGEVVP